MTILGIVDTVFPVKRQNQLFVHQFVRIIEEGTRNVFDVQFYNNKIELIALNGIAEGQKVICETFVNGKFWTNIEKGTEGVFIKINGQSISSFNFDPEEPKIAE